MLFKKKKVIKLSEESIVVDSNNKRTSKGYSRLRDNILYLNYDGKHKVIQIASSLMHEGKTSLCGNLAVSLGYAEKKIIVLDLDFRRPRTHRVFGMKRERGLGEFFIGKLTKEEIIKHTKYKNVDIVTSGQDVYNPAMVLMSDKFKNFIAELREEYDYVLIDTAPILQVSDFIHISKVSDGVLLLVAYGKTTRSQLTGAVKELKSGNIPILGTVFTMYDKKYDVSYSDYGKYYGEEYADIPSESNKK